MLYEAISCPPGHFKKSKEDVENGCANAGLPCQEEHQCICDPCVKAFDVDVFVPTGDAAVTASSGSATAASSTSGCGKMSLCGTMEQTKPLTFRVVDNKQRLGAHLSVLVHDGVETRPVRDISSTAIPYSYEFTIVAKKVGILILEIALDGEQIPESPPMGRELNRISAMKWL